MKYIYFIISLILILVISFTVFFYVVFINKPVVKPLENKVYKSIICNNIYSPFMESDRKKFNIFYERIISVYGAYRWGYVKGHKHSGIDLVGDYEEKVYAIGRGYVVDMHLGFPNRTVVVKHRMINNFIFYSVYKHVEDIKVRVGDVVDENTVIGRNFSVKERQLAKFNVAHLHFEIKHNILDRGSASWSSMNMFELNKYCYDPLVFMKKYLK